MQLTVGRWTSTRSTATPLVIVVHLYGLVEGKRHDASMLHKSSLMDDLQRAPSFLCMEVVCTIYFTVPDAAVAILLLSSAARLMARAVTESFASFFLLQHSSL